MARMAVIVLCVVLVLVVAEAAMPVCDPERLKVCNTAIKNGMAPSASCCSKL